MKNFSDARVSRLEKAAGYSEGFEKATNRFEIMIFSGFTAFTLYMIAGTLIERQIKLPKLDQETTTRGEEST